MNNKPIISFLFGLLILTVIAHHVMEHVIRLSDSDHLIELSELLEDVEEEQETEDELIRNQYIDFQHVDLEIKKVIITGLNQSSILLIYKKIPVPPPELV